jgi:hypothetical protein
MRRALLELIEKFIGQFRWFIGHFGDLSAKMNTLSAKPVLWPSQLAETNKLFWPI